MTDFTIPLEVQRLSNDDLVKAVRICHCEPPSDEDYAKIVDLETGELVDNICNPAGCPAADFCALHEHTGDYLLAELLKRFERLSAASLGNFYDDIDCAKPMPEL